MFVVAAQAAFDGMRIRSKACTTACIYDTVLVSTTTATHSLSSARIDHMVLLVLTVTRRVQRMTSHTLRSKANVVTTLSIFLVVDGVQLLALVQSVSCLTNVLCFT